jgi:nucleoside-diphosphate-sugar epimerase
MKVFLAGATGVLGRALVPQLVARGHEVVGMTTSASKQDLGRLAAGETATPMMTDVRGASNEKAKRELGWKPRYASWRQGFAQGLS